MPSYFEPDLTGLDAAYYVDTYERVVFRAGQKLYFDIPAFHNANLQLVIIDTIPETMVEGTDWVVQMDDIDYDTISKMKSIDPAFDGTLLKSVTITRQFVSQYTVQMKFNQIYPNTIDYAPINVNNQIELTPTLISNMVEQLNYLRRVILNRSGEYTSNSFNVKLMELDIDKLNPNNYVTDEIHSVNTIDGIIYIRPMYGAFFKDSVRVENAVSGTVYQEGIDYEIIEADLVKTARTSNTSGVYETIKIISTIVGELAISYHAYGDEVDLKSMVAVKSQVDSINDFLENNILLTPHELKASPVITTINDKIQSLEGQMRLLLQNGLPTYGDVTTGTSVLKRVTAIDTNLHWWNIASLYQVDGSSDFIMSDVFKFRFKSVFTNMMFECAVAVNVEDSANPIMTVTCLNSNAPDNVLDFSPMLRVIYSNGGAVFEGAIIQIGMMLPSTLQETFVIEDMSGKESCWKLVDFDPNSTPAQDTAVLLPDGNTVWDANSGTEERAFIPLRSGVYVTDTPLSLNVIQTIFGNPYNFATVDPANVPDAFFTAMRFQDIAMFEIEAIIDNTNAVVTVHPSHVTDTDLVAKGTLLIGGVEFDVLLKTSQASGAIDIGFVPKESITTSYPFLLSGIKALFK